MDIRLNKKKCICENYCTRTRSYLKKKLKNLPGEKIGENKTRKWNFQSMHLTYCVYSFSINT